MREDKDKVDFTWFWVLFCNLVATIILMVLSQLGGYLAKILMAGFLILVFSIGTPIAAWKVSRFASVVSIVLNIALIFAMFYIFAK